MSSLPESSDAAPEGTIEQMIVDRFRTIVAQYPDAPALTSSGVRYTYAEMDRWSDAIAHRIIAAGAPVDRPVAIVVSTNVPLVPAALAAVKAGHFYVTIDSTDPDDRIALLLRESEAGLCMVESATDVSPALRDYPLVEIGNVPDAVPPLPPRTPNRYVNLVFTSGTTGKPKGIVSRQAGFVTSALRSKSRQGHGPGERVMFRSLPGFTRANSLLGALLGGATLCSFDARSGSLDELAEYITREKISILQLTPALFRRLMRALPPALDLSGVKRVRCGADIVTLADIETFRKHFPRGTTFHHGYASSETGGGICNMVIDHDTPLPGPLVPMGRPRPDVEVWLRDEEGNVLGAGEVGELCVRSAEVIEGYWKAPELGAGRFAEDPEHPGLRTFYTGDLAMRDEAGLYYFVGRNDFRLRIHNRRIDPLQIESVLLKRDDIADAVVVGKPDQFGEKHLVAYVVMRDGAECVPRAIRAGLREVLPSWMVPARIHQLDAIPVTASAGKVDRAGLVARVDPRRAEESGASDDIERQLVEIWSRVIGTPVLAGDDFFDDLGGESVVAAHLVTEIQRATGTSMPMSLLLELNTVKKMAEYLRGSAVTDRLLVLVQPGGPLPPIFCITGRDGSVIKFRGLAAAIGTARPFYGLTFHGFDPNAFPTSSQTIAACYAEAIRKAQPHGPYYLAGYSGGARSALDVARLFQRQGERIAFLGFIDAAGTQQHPTIWQRIVNRIDMVRERPAVNGLQYVRDAVTRPAAFVKRQVTKHRAARGLAFPAQVQEANRAHDRARKDHISEPYPGQAILFRARNGLGMLGTQPDLGWSNAGVSHLQIVDVRGDHNSMLTEHAGSLGQALLRALEEAGS